MLIETTTYSNVKCKSSKIFYCVLFLCPVLNCLAYKLQSRGISPCIVTHLPALLGVLRLWSDLSRNSCVIINFGVSKLALCTVPRSLRNNKLTTYRFRLTMELDARDMCFVHQKETLAFTSQKLRGFDQLCQINYDAD